MPRALLFLVSAALAAAESRNPNRLDLDHGWRIRTSDGLSRGGAEISTAGFDTSGWHSATAPSTVVSALVADGTYPDPYYGLNLRSIPGATYDFGDNFAVDPMPADSPFRASWWWRSEFRLPVNPRGKLPGRPNRRYWLNFDSINYRANIWLNGRRIADSTQARGMYRSYEFDVTELLAPGVNTVALEIFAPTENDLSISFVDWNPLPPDKNMGVVRDAYLLTTGPVTVRNVQAATTLTSALDRATVMVSADLRNPGGAPVDGVLRGSIGDIAISAPVQLAAGESRRFTFAPVRIDNPLVWWPHNLGAQNLYQLHVEFETGGEISDRADAQFGIRTVSSELDARQHRVFRINGQKILIRGAAWSPDMMLRPDAEREEIDLRYAQEMNLNALRFEGKLEMSDRFFDLADRYGILLLPGWCCCAAWEQWDNWQPLDYQVAAESLRTQVRRLRNHPSVLAFLYGSDNAPPPRAESEYLRVFAEENWPNPTIAGAGDATTVGGGRTGVKMTGPYDYVPPSFWLLDQEHGGAWGFNTETSPGPAIPELPSLRQMMPAVDLWPIDNTTWNYHAGSGSFADTRVFSAALDGRYGVAKDLADYVRKSQAMTYEAERAMFEAYGRNKYTSATGVIQWLMNNAWPGLIWHLYDWYLRPGGGYFGTKKALEPVHVQYSYDDRSIVVVNSLYEALPGYSVSAQVFNLDLSQKFARSAPVDIAADSAARVFVLPEIDGLSRTYFLRLALNDRDGNPVSSNFYWLSTQPDVMDWPNWNYRYVPITTYMDLTGLNDLPPAKLTVEWESEAPADEETDRVTVRNPSANLAFMVHLTVSKGTDGVDIAPIYWSDNYFELFPGESRQVTARYPKKLLEGARPLVRVDGWNVSN